MTEVSIQPNAEIERNWAMLSHLLGLVPIPLVAILGPLLVWLIKKEESSFVEQNAKESASFQITVLIALLIAGWLCFFIIGFFLIIGILLADLILVITAAIKAKQGLLFRYPFALRFF
ncbi:MAG: DUF4870 domain-containing protein [Candidatus Omnitrophica bacterium]|nr:DUF4870 domain-containing protein [Candidatus Omnitrophota bacterium]